MRVDLDGFTTAQNAPPHLDRRARGRYRDPIFDHRRASGAGAMQESVGPVAPHRTENCSGWRRLAAAALAILAGCAASPAASPVKLRGCYFATQDFLPQVVIQEQGFDRELGLQLEIQALAGGAAAIEAMVAGAIDLCSAVGTVPLLSAAERGLVPDRLVAVSANSFTDAQHRGIALLVGPGIPDWAALSGQAIAVNARDSVTAAALTARLRSEGVRGYSLIEIPFPNMGLAIAGGNVAAAGMAEPFLTQSVARGDGRLLDWLMGGGAPFPSAEIGAVVVRTDFLRQDRRAVKSYLRAHLRAVRWINANMGSARALLARRLDLTREVGQRFNLQRWPTDARHDVALLEAMQAVLVETGVLRAPVPLRRVYDDTVLAEVLAEPGLGR